MLVFNHFKILLYANDAKLSKSNNNQEDESLLQKYLDNLINWCISNGMFHNIKKRLVKFFSKKRDLLSFNYKISNKLLNRTKLIEDLGVTFDSKLLFN